MTDISLATPVCLAYPGGLEQVLSKESSHDAASQAHARLVSASAPQSRGACRAAAFAAGLPGEGQPGDAARHNLLEEYPGDRRLVGAGREAAPGRLCGFAGADAAGV